MKRKTKLILFFIIIVAIFILLPIALDWLVFGNDIPSNVTNSDWVGFLGGYVGAIIGALFSLIGIFITIWYTNEQNRLDRELQVRPYCSIQYARGDKIVGTEKVVGSLLLKCAQKENRTPNHMCVLYIKNIGIGPAINFSFSIDEINDGRLYEQIIMKDDTCTRSDLLLPGEIAAFPICIDLDFDSIKESDIRNIGSEEHPNYIVRTEVALKYKSFDITIHAKYQNFLQNQYQQDIIMTVSIYTKVESEKCATYQYDLRLKETTGQRML